MSIRRTLLTHTFAPCAFMALTTVGLPTTASAQHPTSASDAHHPHAFQGYAAVSVIGLASDATEAGSTDTFSPDSRFAGMRRKPTAGLMVQLGGRLTPRWSLGVELATGLPTSQTLSDERKGALGVSPITGRYRERLLLASATVSRAFMPSQRVTIRPVAGVSIAAIRQRMTDRSVVVRGPLAIVVDGVGSVVPGYRPGYEVTLPLPSIMRQVGVFGGVVGTDVVIGSPARMGWLVNARLHLFGSDDSESANLIGGVPQVQTMTATLGVGVAWGAR